MLVVPSPVAPPTTGEQLFTWEGNSDGTKPEASTNTSLRLLQSNLTTEEINVGEAASLHSFAQSCVEELRDLSVNYFYKDCMPI